MNLLKTIIDRLNQRVEVANIFDQIYPLCELNANGNEKAWVHYIGNGQAEVVTNFDAKQGTLFWAKRGKVSVVKTESFKVSGCKTLYQTTFPLTAYAVVRKSHLPCDSEDSQDWIASRIYRLISGTDPDFKSALAVIQYEVIPNGYVNEIKSLTASYEWACVAVDVDVAVVSASEDGCYDVCATGDIPLPDLQPCVPCLTEVAVDGVTITGNGTIADPLVAVGGEGSSILLQTDGVDNGSQTILNLKEGTNITLTDDGVGGVTIDASGGGLPQSLQEVTDVGNTTTNDISFGSGVGAIFNNGAKVKEGTTDAGLGGAKGIAQICSNAYELKWEAGRLYYMEQNGFTIREVTHNFTITPSVNDDSTKGFVNGSRWVLDNGDLYVCSDPTIGAAIWNLQSISVPSLQDVTDVDNTTTNDLLVEGANDFIGQVSSQAISTYNNNSNAYAEISVGTSGQLTLSDGTSAGILSVNNLSNANVQLEFPNKITGNYTIATTADIVNQVNSDWNATTGVEEILNKPTIPDAQVNSDWNSTSGLSEILNKPTIPTTTSELTNDSGFITSADVPTLTSELTNDSGFITSGDIPPQVNSDWNASSGVEEILNKPTLAAVATSGSYNDLTDQPTIVSSISSGTNINVDNTDAANPIINSLADRYKTSSVTSNSVSNGTKNFAVDINLSYIPLQEILVVHNPANHMHGEVTSYDSATGALVVDIKSHTGSGTYTSWVLNLDGTPVDALTGNGTANEIAYFTAARVLTSLPVATYPSLTELSYVKNVTSAIQTQINGKQDTLVSSTNIKTINSTSVLGSGNIAVEPTITAGTTSQYYRGDKTFQTLDKSAVGLGNVDNTSDANKPISTATQTALNGKQATITPASLSKADDTNVTLTLGGTPTTALLQGVSITAGWSGTLADARITSAATWNAKQASLVSGTNIKTINSVSLLGSGDITSTFKNTTDGASSSAVANTFSQSILVAANSVVVGSVLEFKLRSRKTGANAAYTIRLYANTTNNLSGTPILLATYSGGLAQALGQQLNRTAAVKNATTNTEMLLATTSLATDFANNSFVAISVDWTTAQYIIGTVQNTSALDSSLISLISMTII